MIPASANPMMMQAADPPADDVVTKSLRFNVSDSAYLRRTPSSGGNRQTWTFSAWIKRSDLASSVNQYFFSTHGSSGNNETFLGFYFINTTDQLVITGWHNAFLKSTQVFRDVGAWGHLVISCDTTESSSADRMKVYWNGVEITSWATDGRSYLTSSMPTGMNHTVSQNIGWETTGSNNEFGGFLADVYVIDGTALDATSFAEEDGTTGQWKPKAYSGSYGDNGFHLDFKDSSTIGNDVSGNDNDFTATNLAASDVMEDTPTDNYCVMNPLDSNSNNVLDEGNLNFSSSGSSGHYPTFSTMGMRSGKWYWEVFRPSGQGNNWKCAIMSLAHDGGSLSMDSTVGNSTSSVNKVGYSFNGGGTKAHDTTDTSYGSSIGSGEILMVAFNANDGELYFGKDGTWFDSSNPANSTSPAWSSIDTDTDWGVCIHCFSGNLPWMNFGSDPTFGGNVSTPDTDEFKYTPPAGFSALKASNLTASIAKPSEYFDIKTWTGTATSPIPAAKVLDFPWSFATDGGLVWQKIRGSGSGSHYLFDTVRGDDKGLYTNTTDVEQGNYPSYYTQDFDSSGDYSIQQDFDGSGNGNEVNLSGSTYVAWGWKKDTAAGFNIVGWEGNDDGFSGGTRAVAHGLDAAPEMVIAKNRTDEAGGNGNWIVYHKDTTSGDLLKLNTTDGEFTPNSTLIGSIGSTNVSFGNDSAGSEYLNSDNSFGSGTPDTYIGYFFASVAGYSKVGSYTGNSSVDGPFVYCGFRPAFILMKESGGSGLSWSMWDDQRLGYNPYQAYLAANRNAVEDDTISGSSSNGGPDFLSNGFKMRSQGGSSNATTTKYIYYAVAKSPFKYALAR